MVSYFLKRSRRFAPRGRRIRPRVAPGTSSKYLSRYAFRAGRVARFVGRRSPYIAGAYYGYKAGKMLFSRTNIGERIGTGTAKKAITGQNPTTNRSTRTLYTEGLTDIAEGEQIDQRERKLANIRGFRICMEVNNKSNKPLNFNIAIVSPKDGANGVVTSAFFRSYIANDRARDFDNTLSSIELKCQPINTDRYTVLKHKRYRLIPGNSGLGTETVSLSGHSFMNIDWYQSLKRQARWAAAGALQPQSGEVWLVWWADGWSSDPNTLPETQAYTTAHKVIATFKDPKN